MVGREGELDKLWFSTLAKIILGCALKPIGRGRLCSLSEHNLPLPMGFQGF
jgi:hypothetical protein